MKRRWVLFLVIAFVLPSGCAPRGRGAREEEDSGTQAQAEEKIRRYRQYYAGIPDSVDQMLPRIRQHAQRLAALGPRQTGQQGCDAALNYVRQALAGMGLDERVEEFSSNVTVALDRTRADQLSVADEPFSHIVVEGLSGSPQRWPAYALQPNCVQACATHPPEKCPLKKTPGAASLCPNCERPRRLVDLRWGGWDDFRNKDVSDAVVLLDFNSGDAWVRAASLGAAAALFVAPQRTTVYQADAKYMAMLPLHFPRLYLRRADAQRLRDAVAARPGEVRVTLSSRLRFRNVAANCIELTIPGKDRSYAFVLAAHLDARCIAPDLSYGGAEVWGIGELIELTRYFKEHQPNCDIHIMFVSGHWQSQQAMRDYIARDRRGKRFARVGKYFRIAMGVDLVPAGRGVNVLAEEAWDVYGAAAYKWLGNRLFGQSGWRERMFKGLGLAGDMELYGGVRPIMSETLDGVMANRNDRCPLVYAPRYPTAEGAWAGLGITAFAFQTGRLARLVHNTPLDRLKHMPAREIDHQLRPQLKITLATLRHLLDYPPNLLPKFNPGTRGGRGWGGYTQLSGRVMQWDRSIGWFAGRLPGTKKAAAGEAAGPAEPPMQTFLYAYPTDSIFTDPIGRRLRNYMHWPMNPSRGQHRELQSFMFQDIRLLEREDFCINLVYAGYAQTQYDVVGYSIDAAGRIRFATDYGIHGDGNKAFQCTDLDLDTWDINVPVSLFECGTVELFGLIDPQRYDPNAEIFGSWFQSYVIHGEHADRGMAPYLRIDGVKDVASHTDLERWGYTQYGPTAMLFLPADYHTGAEVLLGSWFTNFAILNNPDENGQATGYHLKPGQTIRLAQDLHPTARVCLEQLRTLDRQRLAELAAHDVASPLAKRYRQEAADAIRLAEDATGRRDWEQAEANYMRGWMFESLAYRNTIALLLDVVSTTVLYFVLLVPFSFLMERLVFPQRTTLRTALVSATVFALFAGLLYMFHPGFKLAHNVVVTTTAFVIVVMTIPALILLLVRGVAMLRAIGSKRVITQQSEAESAGVVMAALSLAVSNMRRRKLRTTLTLVTITALVMALVLLTTSAAFDFKILEPTGTAAGSFQGVQIYNARDRRHPLLKEMVEVYETHLKDKARVIRRECVNYGYDHKLTSDNGALHLKFGPRRVKAPFFQIMDYRDNEIVYTLPEKAGSRQVKLSDLIDGEFLAEGDVDVCLLPNNMAEELGVKVGDTVTLMGLPLRVKGIFTAQTEHQQAGEKAELTATRDRLTGLHPVLAGALYAVVLAAVAFVAGGFILRGRGGPRARLALRAALFVGMGIVLLALHPGTKSLHRGELTVREPKTVYLPGPMDRLTDLDGLPMTAMRSSQWREGEPDNPIHAPSNEVVIVPRAWLNRYRLFPSCVYSLIVIPNDDEGGSADIGAWADKLAKEILNVDVFSYYVDPATGKGRSDRISMQTATHVKGSSMMLVVMGVAVLMILAIMTGTVYERMREIHIFSSVGLSPRHVAGMFLIEALVYAGIAAVLGYFLGIISLKVLLGHLKATGQQQEFYPNYLGVFVLYSVGTAVLATVASSLYPIHLASKIINPSGGKTWQLETTAAEADEAAPDALDQWRIRLPFIATTWDEARAMMVYAHDYLAIHQGERSGRFVCQSPPAGGVAGDVIHLTMPVWLAPFERNLTQQTQMLAKPADDGDWWELSLELRRTSGPPYLWRRGATAFVNVLCKHLLRWRAATPAQEAECLKRADSMYPPTDQQVS